MRAMKDLIFLVSSSLCIFIIYGFIKIFHKLWWAPNRLQYLMGLQGIKGPSYRFFYGNAKEMLSMKMEAMNKPLDLLSHNIYPKLQPHFYVWTKLYGKIYIQWLGSEPYLIITEPDLIKEVFNNRDKAFPKMKVEDSNVKKILGGGLTTLEGDQWTTRRKIANYSFHGESLKGMIPAMVDSAEMMVKRWINNVGKEIEVHEEFRLFTSEVISRTAFGSSFSEGQNIFEMLQKLTLIAAKNMNKPRFPGISKLYKLEDDREAEKLEKGMRQSILKIIKKREELVLKENNEESYGDDFIGVLLRAHHQSDAKERISLDNVIDECKSFYFAGQETTNSLLSWTILLLAIHQEWQDEARKEVLEIFGKEKPNSDSISKLKSCAYAHVPYFLRMYLLEMNMIINESLRLYPPVLGSPRQVDREVKLGELVLPRDMILYIPILALHHDPEIWGEDVHLFKPERFSEGVAKATKNNIITFSPFGIGPRICVGLNFALVEAKIALTMILQHYSFTLSPAYVHSPIQALTNRPQHGIQVMLHHL